MSCQKNRQRLIVNLLVGHAASSGLVLSEQQHGKQVASIFA